MGARVSRVLMGLEVPVGEWRGSEAAANCGIRFGGWGEGEGPGATEGTVHAPWPLQRAVSEPRVSWDTEGTMRD